MSGRGARGGPLRGAPRWPGGLAAAGGRYLVTSPQLAASPIHRGERAAVSRREALILLTVLNHPWLLHDHLEDIAEVEFRFAEAQRVKVALVDVVAHGGASDRESLAEELKRRGLAEQVGRIEKAITTVSVWGARPEAAPADVLMTWRQLIALHGKSVALHKELKDAEQALGRDSTEANYSWLQDVKARLSAIDGTEALVEGFGASSGRAGPSF